LSFEWLEPWYSIEGNPAQVEAMGQELRRELGQGHALFGIPVRAIARRGDCDDVLFRLLDGTGHVAVVHLTWTYRPPEEPPWPTTALFPTFDAWVTEGMAVDHADFQN
jgi:hypothetical protein